VQDPDELATGFSLTPGVVEHGLFPPHLTSEILVATGSSIRWFRPAA
jgi:ribose 5-phosphate isomerase